MTLLLVHNIEDIIST